MVQGASGHGGEDEEGADPSQNSATVQLAYAEAEPDVEPEADAAGRVKQARAPRAQPISAPVDQRPRNFFEKLFGIRRQQPGPAPAPNPPRRGRPPQM